MTQTLTLTTTKHIQPLRNQRFDPISSTAERKRNPTSSMVGWQTGICSCFDDTEVCCRGCCCGFYLFGTNAEQISGADKCESIAKFFILGICCLTCLIHKPERQILRAAYDLPEDPDDLVATCLLYPCALCQEAREMKLRGVPPGGHIPVSFQPR